MTKQTLKGVMMLVLIISLAFITAVVSANAQAVKREQAKNNCDPEIVNINASLR